MKGLPRRWARRLFALLLGLAGAPALAAGASLFLSGTMGAVGASPRVAALGGFLVGLGLATLALAMWILTDEPPGPPGKR